MLLTNFLKNQSIFEDLSERDFEALAHAFEVRDYPDGHAIIKEGESGKELYLLIDGRVKVARGNAITGRHEVINLVQPGEMFGMLSLVDNLPTLASCFAAGEVKVAVMQRRAYDMLAQYSAPITLGFQLALARQLATLMHHQEKVLTTIPL